MIVGILKENNNENRVALNPIGVTTLQKFGVDKVLVEKGAGLKAFIADEAYTDKGATITDPETIIKQADLIVKIHTPEKIVLDKLNGKQVLLGQLAPLGNKAFVQDLLDRNLTAFSLDLIPRTTRAQAMDVLSSMATASGYRAVLLAATHLPSFIPMFMTAAGTIKPAKVLILGAGVAGLQAIATSRKLGAVVEAFDVRAAAKEEVLSLGAKFVEVEGATDDTSAGGYAVEQTEEYKQRQAQLIQEKSKQADIVICTAQIPGRKAPLLVRKETVENMKAGSVIVDLAASTGGNCEVTENGKIITYSGVTIIGDSNLPSGIPTDASQMFSKNVTNFLKLIIKEGQLDLNFEDDIVEGACLTHKGGLKNERVKKMMTS